MIPTADGSDTDASEGGEIPFQEEAEIKDSQQTLSGRTNGQGAVKIYRDEDAQSDAEKEDEDGDDGEEPGEDEFDTQPSVRLR